MAAIAWPAELPCQPEQGSWQETPQPDVVSFTPEAGPTIDRRRGTVQSMGATCTFVFTKAQYIAFRDWFRNDLKGGALRFSFDHPVTGEAEEWKFDPKPGWQMSATTNRKVRVQIQIRKMP